MDTNRDINMENMEGTVNEQEVIKTFTQEEVNDIVQARLERERKRLNAMINEDEAIKQELVESRLKLEVAKELREKDYPQELLELINCKDSDTCKDSKIQIMDVFDRALRSKIDYIYKVNGRTPQTGSNHHGKTDNDPVKNAFLY